MSGNKANRKAPSLSSQFKTSLGSLVDRMNLCYPHFIRCIKPNHNQRPNMFVDEFVLTQLGYTGEHLTAVVDPCCCHLLLDAVEQSWH